MTDNRLMDAIEARRAIVAACRGMRGKRKDPNFEAMAKAAHFVIERIGIHDDSTANEVLDVAGMCLARGDKGAVELVAFGFLEDLGNIASHEDVDVTSESIRARLNPETMAVWDGIDHLWATVALSLPEVDAILTASGRASRRISANEYQSIHSTELRQIVQATYRRVAGGVLVGLPDVLLFETHRGGGPHLAKT